MGAYAAAVVEEQEPDSRRRSGILGWLGVLVVVVVAAVVVKTWVLEAYLVPSGSMLPTIHVNDRILVEKLGFELGHGPGRGEIVVFHKAAADTADTPVLVKRVIGLPGDTLRSGPDGEIFVDGHLLPQPWLTASARSAPGPAICSTGAAGEVPAATADCRGDVLYLPAGEYWMMGDNRGGSADSRYWGPVPRANLIGRVVARIWPLGSLHWYGS